MAHAEAARNAGRLAAAAGATPGGGALTLCGLEKHRRRPGALRRLSRRKRSVPALIRALWKEFALGNLFMRHVTILRLMRENNHMDLFSLIDFVDLG